MHSRPLFGSWRHLAPLLGYMPRQSFSFLTRRAFSNHNSAPSVWVRPPINLSNPNQLLKQLQWNIPRRGLHRANLNTLGFVYRELKVFQNSENTNPNRL